MTTVAEPIAPSDAPPGELRVRVAPDALVREGGCLLIGGSPSRLIRLKPAAGTVVTDWQTGGPVGAGRAIQALARQMLDAGILVPDPSPASTADMAVVVPVHGRPEALARCLDAIGRTAPDAAVTIVDDGSPDPEATDRIAAAHAAAIVRHPASRGPAAARNTGFAHTDSPLVAFVDSDVVVGSGCLARLAGHFEDPATGAAAPRVLSVKPRAGPIAGYEARHSSLDMGPRAGHVRPWAQVPYVPSATLVVRRDAFGSGFDERLRVGEDVNLVWRIGDAGWGVWYDPSVAVHHEHRSSLREFAGRRFTYATSIGPLADRHRAALPALRVDAATGVVVLALTRRPQLAACLACGIVARNHAQLRGRARQPGRLAMLLGLRSVIRAWRMLSHAVRRPWWPLFALAGTRSRRAALLLCGAWASGVVEAKATRPSYAVLAVADDLVSGAGTWWSCLRCHTATPLLPATGLRRPRRSRGSFDCGGILDRLGDDGQPEVAAETEHGADDTGDDPFPALT